MATHPRLKDGDRLTREQTSRATAEMEAPDAGDWEPTPFTAAPPPRDGMEQRWVRCRIGGTEDVQNVLKRQQQGWTPRPADTLPPGFAGMGQKFDKLPDLGNIIGNQDCVLMERPEELGRKVKAYYARQTGRLRESIADFVGDRLPRQHGTSGGTVDELDLQVTTGRRPQIAPD